VVASEFLNEHAPYPECHASTLVEIARVDWWPRVWRHEERNPDVGHLGRPKETATGSRPSRWQTAYNRAAHGCRPGTPFCSTENRPIGSFHKVGPSPRVVGHDDDHPRRRENVELPRRLPEGILGPIKNKRGTHGRNVALRIEHERKQGGWLVRF